MIRTGKDMAAPLETICNIDGVMGCLAYCDGMLAMCGDVPELVASDANDDIITKIELAACKTDRV
jgi:hypothetical protein